MSRSFKIITLGCKINQYESAYLHESLVNAGLYESTGNDPVDISIINTCIVTHRASHQSRQEIRKAIRKNPGGRIVATGCYAQVFPEELARIEGIERICGNSEKKNLPERLMKEDCSGKEQICVKDFIPGTPFEPLPISRFSNRTRAYLKIQDGCQSFCSYCIVPFARGHLRSLPISDVLTMIEAMVRADHREIVLTGIHLGKYGMDLEHSTNLNHLLMSIEKEDYPARIRLSSLEITEINDDLIHMVAADNKICRHFHIPLQSGDDGVLHKMNRHYTSAEFASRILHIHEKIPQAAIGIDIMCGFPGEDERAHGNTLSLIRDLPISYLHVFPFSPRKGTPAAAYTEKNDPQTIKKRASELRKIGYEKRMSFHQHGINKEYAVLREGRNSRDSGLMQGKTDNYLPVLFPAPDNPDPFVQVFIKSLEGNVLKGIIV